MLCERVGKVESLMRLVAEKQKTVLVAQGSGPDGLQPLARGGDIVSFFQQLMFHNKNLFVLWPNPVSLYMYKDTLSHTVNYTTLMYKCGCRVRQK